jgi:hypothetical protein
MNLKDRRNKFERFYRDMKPYPKSEHNPLLIILNELFEANPGISAIVLNDKCSDCGCETNIEVTQTSGGYGLQGGALFKVSNDEYIAQCPACYEKHFKIDDL